MKVIPHGVVWSQQTILRSEFGGKDRDTRRGSLLFFSDFFPSCYICINAVFDPWYAGRIRKRLLLQMNDTEGCKEMCMKWEYFKLLQEKLLFENNKKEGKREEGWGKRDERRMRIKSVLKRHRFNLNPYKSKPESHNVLGGFFSSDIVQAFGSGTDFQPVMVRSVSHLSLLEKKNMLRDIRRHRIKNYSVINNLSSCLVKKCMSRTQKTFSWFLSLFIFSFVYTSTNKYSFHRLLC